MPENPAPWSALAARPETAAGSTNTTTRTAATTSRMSVRETATHRRRTSEPEPLECVDRRLALVPRPRLSADDDRLLVTLAGEEDDVAWMGAFNGGLDRGRAIGNEEQVTVAAAAGGFGAPRDGVVDPARGPPRAGPRQ